MDGRRVWCGVVAVVVAVSTLVGVGSPRSSKAAGTNVTLPARAAFYDPWVPQTWSVNGAHVAYHPSAGYYSSDDAATVAGHLGAMSYAGIDVAIVSWWGQGLQHEATRLPLLLEEAARTGVKVAFYYEKEGFGEIAATEISADLQYLQERYGTHPGAATINGKVVVFVYNADDTNCGVADRWKAGNTVGAYIDLKVFTGYKTCVNQPDAWHQYGPASATASVAGQSFAISPGFRRADESSARLSRDAARWRSNVAQMVASGAPWQLVTTFNEWGEGTAVESSEEWSSPSGYGTYLDALHDAATGTTPAPTATTTPATAPTTTTTSSPTVTTMPVSPSTKATLVPVADATVDEANPAACMGSASTLLVDAEHAGTADYWSYLRFDLGASTLPITAATLRLYVTDPTSSAPTVQLSAAAWTETQITWANRPTTTGVLTTSPDTAATGTWISYDVRGLMPQQGTVNLVLRPTSGNGVDFSSRTGTHPPQLNIHRTTEAPQVR
ncbi:MAG: hypothetical protein JWM12_1502 [Ilumatobacteraceae bacterium]|nr:hypothetical protein [Ilumatobacteraceae bacterium]